MDLIVRHQTIYTYPSAAGRVAMRLKLMPVDNGAQQVVDWHVTVNDRDVPGFRTNAFGEKEALWLYHDRLDQAVIVAEGLVRTHDVNGIIGQPRSAVSPLYYLRETPLTRITPAIAALAAGIDQYDGPLARLHALSDAVADAVAYRPGVTSADTSADEALTLGAGVCQDHAQLFIAAARSMGIPARYVSGYLLAAGDNALHETHGWAEAFLPVLGWVGFDPSNRLCVTDHYLRLSSGLDAADAAPIRGSVMMAGDITIAADVRIAQAQEGMEQQQLQRQQQQATSPSDS